MELRLDHSCILKGSTVIVGVSGGRDSMALVHALKTQRPDIKIIAAHLNHGIRPDSDQDADFTKGMMLRMGVDCEVYKPRAPKEGNLEEWGRDKRYEFFHKLLKKNKAEWILTAHHQDDDFESMMLAFLRGTRIKGLSGMAKQRGSIFRPLLETPRHQVNEYVEYHEIHYQDDPSNDDERFKRNFLRHKVIPVLNHVYDGIAGRWQKQKDYWEDLQEMMEISAELFLDKHLDPKEGLDREAYRALPLPMRTAVLEVWFRESSGKRIADSTTIHRWDEAILNWTPRKKTEWTEGQFLVMSKERARVS